MRFDKFTRAVVGNWRGTKQLYLEPPPEVPTRSESALSIDAIAGGSFVELKYDWTFQDEAQSGVLLLGYDEENFASVAWVDSFHMSSRIMLCTGTAANGMVDLLGSYAAPPGPDWSWRITIRSLASDELQIVMHNISPAGQEDLAVQIDYTRSA